MAGPSLFVSGFGPFEDVDHNPSGDLARALASVPPEGVRVRALVLPVSFERAVEALDAALASVAAPSLLLGLGVHRWERFEVELCARRTLARVDRPDVDGRLPARATPGTRGEPVLRTPLEARVGALVEDRPGWRLSEDAGGYVCERVFRHLLEQGEERGVPALFVHVPPVAVRPVDAQDAELRAFLAELLP